MDKLLNYVIESNTINIFFKELLDIKRFENLADDDNYFFSSSIQESMGILYIIYSNQ